ncbi:MAG TPA: NADPH-dependent glutamate synthase [Clostridia bacterium]|nr:NADPH-dependent glutamate synthase [Clostridia bacterium]
MIERQKVIEQDPAKRITNFDEVSLGFDEKTMLIEAARCLNCKNPECVKGCPVNINIPAFIMELKHNNPLEANDIIKSSSSLPAVCGRVCPQESQCEKYCIRKKAGGAIAIGALERYAADFALNKNLPVKKPKEYKNAKVAIIGSGPSGLSCAGELALSGVKVTIFEAFHRAGGVLVYGIPEFRLPENIVDKEINYLEKLGVDIKINTVIGKTFTMGELLSEYDFVFIGSGAGLPVFMNIKGENLNQVYSSNEVLTRVNLMKAYEKDSETPIKLGINVVVVGAGNVAMDTARTAVRLGAKAVTIVYRRTKEDMPARLEEVHHAQEEGVNFITLANPVEILGSTKVEGIKCVRMRQTEPDASGRKKVVPIPDSEFILECDQVIMSLGTSPNPLIKNSLPELKTTSKGTISVDENMETSIKNVYAGGDTVTGAATVILAMGAGKKAAQSILKKITER